MPVEFLGIGATNDGSETHPRSGAAFDKDYTSRSPARTRRHGWDRVLTAYGSGQPGPRAGRGATSRRTPSAAAAARAPAQRLVPDLRREDLRHPRPDQRRPADDALHHRRQRPRAAARGRHPAQGRALRPHPRVHPDRQEGLDQPRAVRPRRRALPTSPTSSPTSCPCRQPRPSDLVRRLLARGLRASERAEADIYCLWGEPLAEHRRADRARSPSRRAAAGPHRRRVSRSRSVRSSAATEEAAWEKAYDTVATIKDAHGGRRSSSPAATTADATRRTRARSGCSPSPSRASATTARCGPSTAAGDRRRRATPTPSSARPRRSPRRCSTTTTSASTSCPPAATTCSRTPSSSAARSSRSSARRSPRRDAAERPAVPA